MKKKKRLEIYKSNAVYQETINDIEKLDGIDDIITNNMKIMT